MRVVGEWKRVQPSATRKRQDATRASYCFAVDTVEQLLSIAGIQLYCGKNFFKCYHSTYLCVVKLHGVISGQRHTQALVQELSEGIL